MNFLKKNGLSIGVILFLIYYIYSEKQNKEAYLDAISELNQKDSVYFSKINELGEREVDATQRQYQPIIIRESNNGEMVQLRNDLKNLSISIKQLKSATRVNTTTTGVDSTVIYLKDSAQQVYAFEDSTEFMNISGEFSTLTSKLNYQYNYTNKISLYSYDYNKDKWFKKPDLRLRLTSQDPNTDMTVETFNIKPPVSFLSVGVGVGIAGVIEESTVKIRPSVNVSVYKPIFTFYKKK